ncbi:MAG: helix-turn-helix transcriptional regulator [Acidimicrobiia bacterium]
MERADPEAGEPARGYTYTEGLPDERVGAVLAAYRRAVCLSRRTVANESGLDGHRLKAYELGRSRITDSDLVKLAEVYRVDVEDLLPPRRAVEVDVDNALLRLGSTVRAVGDPDRDMTAVLREYLNAVYELRNTPPDRPLPLREEDLAALADALGHEPDVIETRLMDIMDCTRDEAASMRRLILRRRLVAPAAGLIMTAGLVGCMDVGATGGGGARGDDPEVEVEIGDAIVIERGDDEPTVRGGDDAGTDEVEIGTAIVIERGDDEPTVRD